MLQPRRLYAGLIICFCLLAACHASADEQNIQFGILPYVSPGQMAKFHAPLRAYIEATLDTPVSLVTAPDFKEFIDRTRTQQYDIMMTAPHLGKLAETQGYSRIAHTLHVIQGVYLVHKDSDIYDLRGLKGKVITLLPRPALLTLMVENQLTTLGMEPNKDVIFRHTSTHNNAMYAPLRGESDASVTGTALFNSIGDHDRQQVRVIGKTTSAPGFMVMATNRLSEAQRIKLIDGLLNYINSSEGRKDLTTTGLKGFSKIKNETINAMKPYIQGFIENKK